MPDAATSDIAWLRDVLVEQYAFPAQVEVQRVAAGTETDNFTAQVVPGGQRFFVKVRRRGYPHGYQERLLELEQRARRSAGVRLPVPRAVESRDGLLLVPVGERALSVHDFVDDARTSVSAWTPEEAADIGRVLGRLHGWLADCGAAGLPVPELWWSKPAAKTVASARRAVDAVHELQRAGQATHADAVRLDQLLTRIDDVERHRGRLVDGLPPVERQLVHGDFSRPNLLMRGRRLAAVLDPRMRMLPAAWELGRVAFDPLTVAESETAAWMGSAVAMVAAYQEANPKLAPEQVTACARMALLHALLSTYGVFEHYLDPDPVDQTALDLYWDHRARMVRAVLEHLEDIEGELSQVAGRGHQGGRGR